MSANGPTCRRRCGDHIEFGHINPRLAAVNKCMAVNDVRDLFPGFELVDAIGDPWGRWIGESRRPLSRSH
jgi:hypothetical protein